jgi:hypothetical protein
VPEEAHMNVPRRHAVKHDLHALDVTSARWPKHDLASGFKLNDPFFLEEVAMAATYPVGRRHKRLSLRLIEKTLAKIRMRDLDRGQVKRVGCRCIFGLDRRMGIADMAKRQQPWWWRSEALGQVAVTLFAAVVAAYLARLLMLYFP